MDNTICVVCQKKFGTLDGKEKHNALEQDIYHCLIGLITIVRLERESNLNLHIDAYDRVGMIMRILSDGGVVA